MSGGVGPTCNETTLQKETKDSSSNSLNNKTQKPQIITPFKKATKFLSVRHYIALGTLIIFTATGLVTLQDFSFVLFSLIYIFSLFKFSFPHLKPLKQPIFSPQVRKLLSYYVLFSAIIGLFLPIAYIIEGILLGDEKGVKAASPHVFLLCSQLFTEGLSFGLVSLPSFVFVPVLYNARRIFTIIDWLREEFEREDVGGFSTARRFYVGKGLAIVNMGFWSYNLFGFLLPVFLPKAFRMYYSEYD